MPVDLGQDHRIHETIILLGGSVSTVVSGLAVMLGLTMLRGGSRQARLSGYVCAFALLTEGTQYMLFTAIHPTGGDFADVLDLWGRPSALRWIFIVFGGVATLAVLLWCFKNALSEWSSILHAVKHISRRQQFTLSVVPFVLLALPSFVFNWDLLAPGLWHWPNLTMLAVYPFLSLFLVTLCRPAEPSDVANAMSLPAWKWVASFNITLSAGLFFLCWFVLQREIIWG